MLYFLLRRARCARFFVGKNDIGVSARGVFQSDNAVCGIGYSGTLCHFDRAQRVEKSIGK